MTPTRRCVLAGVAGTLAAPFLARATSAQAAWPTRPVRVIIPYPPAGGADTVGRIFFTKLGEVMGQQFVIDNRGGRRRHHRGGGGREGRARRLHHSL